MNVCIENLSVDIKGRRILNNINVTLPSNDTIGLIGPNGSGKSTLLRSLCGLVCASQGKVALDGTELKNISQRMLARNLAFVPQHATAEPDMKVETIVKMGRNPHRSAFTPWNNNDAYAVERAIQLTKIESLTKRSWKALSGGERQRCQIARALAQQTEVLLLDEPTNHLDVHHQIELMHLITTLPLTVVIALHDLNLAANFCDGLVVMQSGQVVGLGKPDGVLNKHFIKSTWDVDANVIKIGNGKATVQFDYQRNSIKLAG